MLLKRTISALAYLCVLIPALVFSHTYAFPIVMSICAIICCYEMIKCIGQHKNPVISIPVYICAVFFPIYVRISSTYDLNSWKPVDGFSLDFFKSSLGVALVMGLFIFGYAVFNTKKISVSDACTLYAMCFYIIAACSCAVYIRDYILHGQFVYLLIFFCSWLTDTFAYFSGRLFGKHKLIPEVSPKKTVEGALGGILFCVITILVLGFVFERFFNDGSMSANYIVLAISGVFISICAQIGDLIMSLIKRHYNIKDFGVMFPGHGGMLDRFDSVLAVSVILAFISTYFNLFSIK